MDNSINELQKELGRQEENLMEAVCLSCGAAEPASGKTCDRCLIETMLKNYTNMAKNVGGCEAIAELKEHLDALREEIAGDLV